MPTKAARRLTETIQITTNYDPRTDVVLVFQNNSLWADYVPAGYRLIEVDYTENTQYWPTKPNWLVSGYRLAHSGINTCFSQSISDYPSLNPDTDIITLNLDNATYVMYAPDNIEVTCINIEEYRPKQDKDAMDFVDFMNLAKQKTRPILAEAKLPDELSPNEARLFEAFKDFMSEIERTPLNK